MEYSLPILPTISTTFIVLSAIMVAIGWYLIRKGKIEAHKKAMLVAAIFAIVFFIIYMSRTIFIGNTSFGGPEQLKIYYTIFLIFLTLIAFTAVAYDGFSSWFTIPFILLLAVIQVAYQLYYFMHMSHKGHEMPAIYMYSGIFVAFLTVLTFVTIIWW